MPNGLQTAGTPMGYMSLVPRVIYRGLDNHIHEFHLSGGWKHYNMTGKLRTPLAAGDPIGYLSGTSKSSPVRVIYRGQDNHIYELCLSSPTERWQHLNMTGPLGAPLAAGNPRAYFHKSARVPRVVYRGQDNHIHELSLTDRWRHFNMTGKLGAPLAVGDPMGYSESKTSGDIPRVVYRGQDNHIHELSLTDRWRHFKLTEKVGAPPAAGNPMAGLGSAAAFARVVYRGQDNHIYELSLTDRWKCFDMHKGTSRPLAIGDPMWYLRDVVRVVYRGQDNHIHEIHWNNQWFHFDMTLGTKAPLAAGDPMGYSSDPLENRARDAARVVYRGQDNHIYELFLTDRWKYFDMSTIKLQ